MARGPKRHMKRMAQPSHWFLDKMTGVWQPRPSSGPHKLRECLPLMILLRNRLKYQLNYKEAKQILIQRLIKVDGKIRTDDGYPQGFMDVVSIAKTNENFRLLYDTKGRFVIHPISEEEASYKLCKVKKVQRGHGSVTHIVTHDGRTIRFADPSIKTNDTVMVDLSTGKIKQREQAKDGSVPSSVLSFQNGQLQMLNGGNNIGRVGVIVHTDKHQGGFDIVHLKDQAGHEFSTRLDNVMVIGEKEQQWVSLPKGNGIKLSIQEDRNKRLGITKSE